MKQPPARHPSPRIPSGLRGRPLEPPMPPRPPKPSLFLIALALLPSACFDPQIAGTDEDGSDGDTTAAATDDGMTTIEPDGSSGEPLAVCGNGVIEGDEACDDEVNDGRYGGCNADCTAPGPFCGDGIVNGEEPCDDGDDVDGNGCNVDCVVSGTVLWTMTYDGPDHGFDAAWDVDVDAQDNVIVAGSVDSDGITTAWVRKYSPQGAADWTQFFPSDEGTSSAASLLALPDGGAVFGGSFGTPDAANGDAWLRRISNQGDPNWTRTHASPQRWWDDVIALDTDADGYLYALFSTGDQGFVRKYDAEGAELWSAFLDEAIHPWALATDSNGWTVVVGTDGSGTDYAPYIAKHNSDGGLEWSQTLEEYDNAYFTTVDVDDEGNTVAGLVSVESDERILFIDPNGLSTRELFPHSGESPKSIQTLLLLNDGHLIAGGIKGDDGHLWVTKYASDDAELWTHTYNGDDWGYGFDIVSSVATDSTGNVLAAGFIQDDEATQRDVWVTKLAP